MATLLNLTTEGALSKLDVGLSWRAQEVRRIFALARLKTWLVETLPELVSAWNLEESPAEQLDALLEIYASGETLVFGHQFKPLQHKRDGIWELKTADLRIFGWFPMKDVFVGAVGDTAGRIKEHKLYGGYLEQTGADRDKLDLDPPKFLPGEDPNVVLSNFSDP